MVLILTLVFIVCGDGGNGAGCGDYYDRKGGGVDVGVNLFPQVMQNMQTADNLPLVQNDVYLMVSQEGIS